MTESNDWEAPALTGDSACSFSAESEPPVSSAALSRDYKNCGKASS